MEELDCKIFFQTNVIHFIDTPGHIVPTLVTTASHLSTEQYLNLVTPASQNKQHS